MSSLVGSRFSSATIKDTNTDSKSEGENSTPKNKNNQHHHARVPSGKGVGEMPLAATVKSQMLRLLRRSKSTRGPPSGSSRSSRKNGGGDTAMVIPNKRYSVLVDSPSSPNNGVVPLVEPYTMALGSPVAVTTPSGGSKHVEPSRKQVNNTQRARESNHRSSSQARRHRSQVIQFYTLFYFYTLN